MQDIPFFAHPSHTAAGVLEQYVGHLLNLLPFSMGFNTSPLVSNQIKNGAGEYRDRGVDVMCPPFLLPERPGGQLVAKISWIFWHGHPGSSEQLLFSQVFALRCIGSSIGVKDVAKVHNFWMSYQLGASMNLSWNVWSLISSTVYQRSGRQNSWTRIVYDLFPPCTINPFLYSQQGVPITKDQDTVLQIFWN